MSRPDSYSHPDFAGIASTASFPQGRSNSSPAERLILREDAARIQFSRDLRRKLFKRNIFGEPAWDILLTLYVIDSDRRRLSTGDLCKLAGLPLTTGLRWLDCLDEDGLIKRLPSTLDQRIVHVELTDNGRTALDDYFRRVREAAVFGPIASGR